MSAIHLDNLSFSYSSAIPILSEASCSLGDGWTGIVGANGSGKTTLLRLIDGTLSPNGGALGLDPTDALVVRCPQTADAVDPNIERLAEAWDGEAHAWMGRLALQPEDLERWPTMSPGERKRWQVGGALYQDPDILLLDEPTNHLDAEARDLLIAALNRFRGAGVVVSHDRTVLNGLCRRILRIENGATVLWQGAYDFARTAWEEIEQAEIEGYRRVCAEHKKVERRLADKKRASATKIARHKRQLRTAGIKDKDARSMEKKGRFEGGQRQGSHEISLLRDEAERLAAATAGFDIRRRLGGELFFDFERAHRRRLLAHEGPIEVAGTTLIAEANVVVERDDRVLLIGPNGAGKTTLFQALLARSTLEPDRILYLPQELTVEQTRDLVTELRSLDAVARGRVLGMVALLGSDPERILATDIPSPGEARKLLIASGLGRGVWVLLLDEPTNHLDLPSIERLERALIAYPGAVVVVTHDEDFRRETTDTVWRLERGVLQVLSAS